MAEMIAKFKKINYYCEISNKFIYFILLVIRALALFTLQYTYIFTYIILNFLV